MPNAKFLIFFLTVVIFTLASCAKEEVNDVRLDHRQEEQQVMLRTVGEQPPQTKPTRKLVQVTKKDMENGDHKTTWECKLDGTTCDIGAASDLPYEEVNTDLVNERRDIINELDDPTHQILKHFFLSNALEDIFPYIYKEETLEGIRNDEIEISYQDQILLVSDVDTATPLFAYDLN